MSEQDGLFELDRFLDNLGEEYSDNKGVKDPEGTLIGSSNNNGTHFPIFDFDFPVVCIPSKTPGHFHVYLGKAVSEDQFRYLLSSMVEAGLVQKRWAENFNMTGEVYLQVPAMFDDKSRRSRIERKNDE